MIVLYGLCAVRQCGCMRLCAAVCSIAAVCVWQYAAVCGSAAICGSARGSAHGSVRQRVALCGSACYNVWQYTLRINTQSRSQCIYWYALIQRAAETSLIFLACQF
jgi:hypothetical protein